MFVKLVLYFERLNGNAEISQLQNFVRKKITEAFLPNYLETFLRIHFVRTLIIIKLLSATVGVCSFHLRVK